MSDPFLGEIRIFGFTFAPRGWAFASGQTLPIRQYTALFAILGVTYGGDGVATFGLPNFVGNVPLAPGQSLGGSDYVLGETGGVTEVALTVDEMAAHTHQLQGATLNPANPLQVVNTPTAQAMFGISSPGQAYAPNGTQPFVAFSPSAIGPSTGTAEPHANQQPFLTMNFCVCLEGVFPQRN